MTRREALAAAGAAMATAVGTKASHGDVPTAEIMELQDADVIVLHFPLALKANSRDIIYESMGRRFPRNTVLILDGRVSLEIVRPRPEKEEDRL